MRYAWLAIAIFAARFVATAIAYPARDGDLAWQRWLGATILRAHAIPSALGPETFSAVGAPWVPQEWAFSIAASLAGSGAGWAAFAGCVALAATAALALSAVRAERLGASPRANLLCTVFAGFALFESFGVRAQVAVWPMLALFLFFLDFDSPLAYAAIAVAALWSNFHASAMLVPIVAAAAAAGTFFDEGARSPNVRRRAIVAAGCALAICCNPFGVRLPLYALSLFSSTFKSAISEWKPTDLGDTSFLYGALPLLLIALVYFAGPSARRARDTIVLVAFAYLLLGAARNVALFGIVALPLVAVALTRGVPFFARDAAAERAVPRAARILLPAFSLVLAVVVAIGLVRNQERGEDALASHAMASIATLPGERRIFCADFAWCGLAIGAPRERVFLDGRADPFPADVWDDFLAIARIHHDWLARLDARGVNTVVTQTDSGLDDALARTRGWQRSYADAHYRVWVRAPATLTARTIVSCSLPFSYVATIDGWFVPSSRGEESDTISSPGATSAPSSSSPDLPSTATCIFGS